MDRDVNLDILRKEALVVLNKAEKLINDGMLSKACLELKQTVLKAEEIFHISGIEQDKEFLLDSYMKMAKYYSKIYYITYDRKDIHPACMYYEKIIYFYEEELRNKPKELIKTLNKMLEAYVQLLWIALEIKDYKLFNKFMPKALKHSLRLSQKSKMYEDEQYFILVNIFIGDFHKIEGRFRSAYVFYLVAMKKISKIYKEMPNEGIRNDLILVYNHLSEIAKVLKRTKDKIKWDEIIQELQKESELVTNEQ